MRVENQIGLNEWLLGSTVLCKSCGCLWLVPSPQAGDTYLCRQCGSPVKVSRTLSKDSPRPAKKNIR